MMLNPKYTFLSDDFSDRKNVLFFKEYINLLDNCEQVSLLDIGCGTGNSAEYWKGPWTGVTVNTTEIKAAPADRDICRMDAHELGFDNCTFENFMFWDSLEHCVSPYIALCEAKRVTKIGGHGLIFMPGLNWIDHHNHIHCLIVPQMIQLFKRVGLQLLKVIELTYPHDETLYCEGMAIYLVQNNPRYEPKFSGGYLKHKRRRSVFG